MNKISKKKMTVSQKWNGERLDVFLAEKLKISRSQVQKLIKSGSILLNGDKPKKTGEKMEKGMVIELGNLANMADDQSNNHKEEIDHSGKIKIVADEADFVVIEKPSGLLAHPTEAGELASVSAWILVNYPKTKGVGDYANRPGIVHRLDKEASGLLVIAKNQKMFDHLKTQFKKREVEKEYTVLVHGVVESDHGIIDFAIDRGKGGKMASRPKTDRFSLKTVMKVQPGKEAMTEFWVKKRFARYTLLSVKIHTGRTHQIRVHMFAFNHQVVGDTLYFNKKLNRKRDEELGRLFLHASRLCFTDLNNQTVCFEAELPGELKVFLKQLN